MVSFMVLQLLSIILMYISVANTACSICVTQPLITSGITCPVCSSLDGEYNKDEQNGKWLKKIGSDSYTDADNPNNWTTCGIQTAPCNASSKYRAFDGSCNNLKHSTWGMSNSAYARILPPNYRDKKYLLSLASDGEPLPLARRLSTSIFKDANASDAVTLVAMQWAQVVSHNMIQTPNAGNVDCCSEPPQPEESPCIPFTIPGDDYFYSKYNVTCTNFVRKRYTFVGKDCEKGPVQQINLLSHFLDGKVVYGVDLDAANSLRTFEGGKLKMQKLEDGREFLSTLPPEERQNVCYVVNASEPCYAAGDKNVNQNVGLSVLVTLLTRLHNKMAAQLQQIHCNWSDEDLYQETKRILVAILQHVTYNEWLPYYLGQAVMNKYGLYPQKSGYTQYKAGISTITLNEFAASAFRVVHSAIQGTLDMYDENYQIVKSVQLSDWLLRPVIIQESSNYDQFLVGLIKQPMTKIDTIVTTEITNLMFKRSKPYGLDLIGIDILRGRDHGIPNYVQYLEVCSGFKARSFEDFKRVMPKKHITILKNNYKSYEDVDLYVGSILENYVVGSRLGPTNLCIFREEFYRKKWGDRFWYEVEGQPHSFTEDQLQEIRKITLSKLICDGSDHISRVPQQSFLPVSAKNKLVQCKDVLGIDFAKF